MVYEQLELGMLANVSLTFRNEKPFCVVNVKIKEECISVKRLEV